MLIISRWSGRPHGFQGMDYCVPEVEIAGKNPFREEILRIILRLRLRKALKEVEKKAKEKKKQLGPRSRVIIAVSIKEIK